MKKLVINKTQWELFTKVWGKEYVEKHHILDEQAEFVKLKKKDIRGNYKFTVKKGSLPIEQAEKTDI